MSDLSMPARSRPWLGAVLTLLAAAATPRLALGADDPFDRPGLYLGASAVYSFNVFENQIEDVFDTSVDVDDSWGASGRVGYRIASWFALEAHYEWVDEFDIALDDLDAGPVDHLKLGTLDAHAATLNTRWILPIWRIQPYLLLGVGGVRFDFDDATGFLDGDDEIGWAGRLGGGLDLYLTKNLVLNAEGTTLLSNVEFHTPLGNVDHLFYVSASAGLQWRF